MNTNFKIAFIYPENVLFPIHLTSAIVTYLRMKLNTKMRKEIPSFVTVSSIFPVIKFLQTYPLIV